MRRTTFFIGVIADVVVCVGSADDLLLARARHGEREQEAGEDGTGAAC